MAAVFSAPPEAGMITPRFAFQHSMIPRPKKKADTESSPTSVIADMRFISPGSSSSSSKCQSRSLERSCSTSDGEFSDPDSTGTSQELGKSENSGSLESLPETHSLTLKATNASVPAATEMSKTLETRLKQGDRHGEATCRIPLFPALNAEMTSRFVVADRTSNSGRGQDSANPHSLAAAWSDKNYEDWATTARANNSRALPIRASEVSAVGDQVLEPNSEWPQTTTTSSESASEHEGKESSGSSTRCYAAPESGYSRRRDHRSRPAFSAELSSTGTPLERSVGPGAAANFGYSGTPLRLFHGGNTYAYSPSPRVQKTAGAYILTPSSSGVGLRHQHRFLSGPIVGSMIPKPTPSKWDDADKWIVSPGRKQSPTQPHHRPLQPLLTGRRHSIALDRQIIRSHHGIGSPDYSTPPGEKPMSPQFEHAFINAGIIEVPIRSTSQRKHAKALSFSDISRKSDTFRASGKSPPAQKQDTVIKEANGQRRKVSVPPSSTDTKTNTFLANDKSSELKERPLLAHNVDEERQQAHEYPVDEPETAESIMNTSSENSKGSQVSKQPRSVSMQELSTVSEPVSLQDATKFRDMGTQMTPIESPKNSTCTTPGLNTASPTRPNTPAGVRAYSLGTIPVAVDSLELQSRHMEKLELRNLARNDQRSLGRSNIWTTREEEDMESAACLREDPDDLERLQLATKATSWEESEQTKVLARFKNKEAKITAWEENQKTQAEAEMKKTEAKVEKILADANEKMKERLASTSKKAAEMTAAAEAVRNQQAAKIAVRAELMRKGGLLSPPKTSFKCCFRFLRG